MHMKTLKELEQEYHLELDKIVEASKNKKIKKIILQFPDGLKPYATMIVEFLEGKCDCDFIISLESCFGACDIPESSVDLIVQFGHAGWGGEENRL